MNPFERLGVWLSDFPYENLSKRSRGHPRSPDRLTRERRETGAGGTCFSLVNLAAQKARDGGLDPHYYLGERPDGPDRHCVVGFPKPGVYLDPGYLCFRPLPLRPGGPVQRRRIHNILHLQPGPEQTLRVSTERKGQRTWRYTLRTEPVSRDRFERAWVNSFQWESVMNSLVLTRLTDRGMLCYMNGRLEAITRENRRRLEPDPDRSTADQLAELFGVGRPLLNRWNLTVDPETD